jgi:ubiquinone/menaquinone biosynthesis C-methylase UbiE
MRMFLRRSAVGRDPLPIVMSGVRMGERVLQVGVDDPKVAGALAAKVGLSGHSAIVVSDEAAAVKARGAAAENGALVDVHVSNLAPLPYPEKAFDVVVINSVRGLLASLEPSMRQGALRELHRVLRPGGRLVTIEGGTRSGLASLLRSDPARDSDFEKSGGSVAALRAAGFSPVRLLGDLEGFRFTEGLKSGA